MKKKIWTIIIIILVAIGVAIAVYQIWFADHKKYYQPEIVIPEVFHDVEFDADYLIGEWVENSLHYYYNEDGTAVTWDRADDVEKDEGTILDWTLEHNIFTHYYYMEIGGAIPKVYNMKVLELDMMEYEDDYGVNHKFKKIEEEELIN